MPLFIRRPALITQNSCWVKFRRFVSCSAPKSAFQSAGSADAQYRCFYSELFIGLNCENGQNAIPIKYICALRSLLEGPSPAAGPRNPSGFTLPA